MAVMEKKGASTAAAKDSDKPENFVSWIAGLFSGVGDPERDKKRQLKQIGKDLTKVRYRFYRPKGGQALPGLAKLFYEIYKITANASVLLQNADKSQALKALAIEYFFNDDQRQLIERLSENSIRERAKTTEPKVLAAALKDDMVTFFSSLDSQRIRQINETYNLIHTFTRFIAFDYYFVLKKFDSSLAERSFGSTPKFDALNIEYITDDLKDFQEISLAIDRSSDWEPALAILRTWKGFEIVDKGEWTRIVNIISGVNQSTVLSLIVRHAAQDPYYKPSSRESDQRIVEPYLDNLRTKVEETMKKILTERRDAQIDKLAQVVFGTKDLQRAKYYNDKANSQFSKKLTTGFLYTAPINGLKAFLLDYFKKDIRELQELILIRGKWTTNVLSQQMSDTYYQIMALSDQVIAFDEGLSEEKDLGMKLRKAIGRVVERDPGTAGPLRQILGDINDRALKLTNDCAGQLIGFGKSLKMVLEDYDRRDHEIIINWKELEALSDIPIKNRIAEVYKRLYYFIQLLQIYLKTGRGPQNANEESSSD